MALERLLGRSNVTELVVLADNHMSEMSYLPLLGSERILPRLLIRVMMLELIEQASRRI